MTENYERLFGPGGRGVFATMKRDGRPQLSTIDFCYDRDRRLARISTVEASAKAANVRRDGRASLYVAPAGMAEYAVAEGFAELSPVARAAGDEVVEELVDVYRRVQGEHPDWDDYRRAMVQDRRLVIRFNVLRFYGFAP